MAQLAVLDRGNGHLGKSVSIKPRPKQARERSGRLSRRNTDAMARVLETYDRAERDALEGPLRARHRVLGVRPSDARDQMAGSFAGRLCLSGELTRVQYDASQTYLADLADYHRAIHVPKQAGAVDLNATHGSSGDYEATSRVVAAIGRMVGKDGKHGARGAVQDAQNDLRGGAMLFAALDLCLVQDKALTHLVGDFRLALNALVKFYGMEG